LDLYLGFRNTILFAGIIVIIIFFYNKTYGVKKFFKYLAIFFVIFLLFSAYGNLRTEIRLFNINGIILKISSEEWWLYNLVCFEPMHIFGVLNQTVANKLECSGLDIYGTSLISSLIPLNMSLTKYYTFHDCFQPILFPEFPYIASNIWAEFYSYFNIFGIFFISLILGIILLVNTFLLDKGNIYIKLFSIVFLSLTLLYIQREEFNLLLFSFKKVVMGVFIFYLISQSTKIKWKF
jgi:hypothetical protein